MAKKVENTIAAMTGFPGDGGLGNPADTETPVPEPQDANPREPQDIVVDFPLPKGFEPPAGTKNGEEFTALASLKLDESGGVQLTKIDGIPVNGKPEEADEAEEKEGEQNPPGATGAEPTAPSTGGAAIASARNVMGDMGMPA